MSQTEDEIVSGEQCLGKLDYENAYKHFDKATKLDPRNALAYFGKAESSLGLPNIEAEEITASYKKAIELDPNNPQYLEAYASFCMDAGRFGEAESYYNKAAELDEDNAPFYYSEFAIQYYNKAPIIMEKFMDEKTKDMVARKALEYLLKSLGIGREEALRLLK